MYPDLSVALAIALAAIVTYGLRIGGLLLADRLPDSGPFKRFMDALPGTILVSLVAPGIIQAGIWGMVATVLVILTAIKSRNAFFAMLVGMIVVAASRALAGG